jgi:hypothetical protein
LNTFIQTILEWPVIVQGSLGSALFALIFFIGQKFTTFTASTVSSYSSKTKEDQLNILWQQYAGLKAFRDGDKQKSGNFQIGLIYQAMRSLFTGLIWLALGLIFSSFIPTLGVVGFIGFLYHMFQGLNCVQKIDKNIDPTEKMSEIAAQLKELKLNNSSKGTPKNGAHS